MRFASPLYLLALALIPLAVAAYLAARQRRRRYAIRFSAASTLRAAAGTTSALERHLPGALALLAVALLIVGLAHPQLPYRTAVGQANMMLVTDHSGSMAADDVQPTRLTAAISAANTFIDQLPGSVHVGAITFSSSPDAAQGPVTDHSLARGIINGQTAGGGTDTGDALALALQLLRGSDTKHPPSAIVLLSDGAANAGPSPVGVAHQARHDRIPIYTVALGTPSGTLSNPDPLAPPVPVPPDPALMRQIARISGARAFNAKSAGEVSSIYRSLGSQLGSVQRRHDITAVFAIAGAIALLGAAVTSVRFWGRLP
jgi:Ca-activated chloride channel family protein